jgi:hypothetical protein
MDALGDSMTRGFATNGAFSDYLPRSYATGTEVNSLYRRLLAQNPAIGGRNYNDAADGSKMANLNGQMASAVSRGVDLVTMMIGAGDVCVASAEAEMTSVQTFHDQFVTAMNTFAAGLPNARLLVLSVPDVYRTWELLKDDAAARSAWSSHGLCRTMFENPQSTDQADVDRRDRVRQRIVDYNTELANVCALYTECRFDDNTVFNLDVNTSDFSTVDYVHPSTEWQSKVAAAVWPYVPQATVTISPESGPKRTPVTLTGSNFSSGETVKFKYKTQLSSPSTVALCSAVASTDGTASCDGTIPTSGNQGPKGAHSIVAKGATSLIKVKTSFVLV